MAGFSEELHRLEAINRVVESTKPAESPFAYYNLGSSRYDAGDSSSVQRQDRFESQKRV